MASLEFNVGAINAVFNANDTNAADVVRNYMRAYVGEAAVDAASNQQIATAFVNHLAAHVIEVSKGYQVRAAREAAAETASENATDWN